MIAAFSFVLCVALFWLVVTPSTNTTKSLAITIESQLVLEESNKICSVLISNASDLNVQYAGGFGKAWLETAFRADGDWNHGQIRTPGGGVAILLPHETLVEKVEVPEEVAELRIGLSITCLTWRGRLGWRIASSLPEVFRPLSGFLLIQDERKRSTTEWSEAYIIVRDRVITKPNR
jgi:hypothetical protein